MENSLLATRGPLHPFEIVPESLPRAEDGSVLWSDVFEADRPIRVEIGVGTSTFLIDLAERSPEYSYLGFEYSAKRVAKFLQKAERRAATNIRMLRSDATRWLRELFLPGSVEHFYVNHPDPWPKRRHEKKRLINTPIANLFARLLAPGGGISLRTDFAAYAQHMLEVLDATEGLINLSSRGAFSLGPLEAIPTLYESKFLKAGRQIFYLEYSKSSSE